MKKSWIIGLAVFIGTVLPMGEVLPETRDRSAFVTIGTGGTTGVYYPAGNAIARIVNPGWGDHGVRCTVESTAGSVFNVNAILAGDLEFGIVQSDRQYQACNGLEEWAAKGPQERLRAVFSLHPESVTLMASVDSGIRTLADLKNKRVNIGNPGSGQRQNAIDALEAAGLDYEKDMKAEGIKADEAPVLLQEGRIDAFFYTVGHPSQAFFDAAAGAAKVRFVPVTGPGIDRLVAEKSYYAKCVVPVDLYPGVAYPAEQVDTFGMKATFMTSAEVPEDVVYTITRIVFENLEAFRKLHPAFQTLTRDGMLEGQSAPIHPGAMRYYREAGLMK
ncbi:TAXI family TRAP transporter solute-binding subunit [Desulfococcus sp.]|uniref:TAXI family TRAP transporter solute-binding subunit n=1 Tax=Desulfococcus sp. TaxID=2025834 RepID=UPI003594659A